MPFPKKEPPCFVQIDFDSKWLDNAGFITNISYPFVTNLAKALGHDKEPDIYVGSYLKEDKICQFQIKNHEIQHDFPPDRRIAIFDGKTVSVMDAKGGETLEQYAIMFDMNAPEKGRQTVLIGRRRWVYELPRERYNELCPTTLHACFSLLSTELSALFRMYTTQDTSFDIQAEHINLKNRFLRKLIHPVVRSMVNPLLLTEFPEGLPAEVIDLYKMIVGYTNHVRYMKDKKNNKGSPEYQEKLRRRILKNINQAYREMIQIVDRFIEVPNQIK